MGKKVTIGGNRLGSGNQMKTELHNYGRSTHNLSNNFISSLAPGVLVPFYCKPALNGDTFDIDLASMVRTIPTQAPLFGSFKLQLDMFQCPIRLYHGLLHNNALNIGMKMADVKLPMLGLQDGTGDESAGEYGKMNNSSLMKYLGLSGIGKGDDSYPTTYNVVYRNIQAIPVLCYYDTFKNYYANRAEENAFVISGKTNEEDKVTAVEWYSNYDRVWHKSNNSIILNKNEIKEVLFFRVYGTDVEQEDNLVLTFKLGSPEGTVEGTLDELKDAQFLDYGRVYTEKGYIEFTITFPASVTATDKDFPVEFTLNKSYFTSEIVLKSFPLDNIDKMRNDILKESELGEHFFIYQAENGHDYLPYSTIVDRNSTGIAYNRFVMNGLCVKTYQSDLFNAWIQTEWIDGVNGIAAVTAVSTAGNQLKLDALNLAQKVYNMLNRIAVSGGTYEDWQEAVYSQNAIRHAETPIYLGGMSSEVVFEEIVSSAAATSDGKTAPLGSLAGKGKLLGNKGGKLYFKVHEPSYILGIVSITPRVCYTQGNSWDLTDLQTMDDLHKPALDGIGFQDLITEQAAWWDAKIKDDSEGFSVTRTAFGKVPAWINYMTDYDKAFGDFAEEDGKGFMVLSRNYERANVDASVADLTTYIDPTKFNYAFAYKEIAAQNFWVQIAMNIKARRIMSAKIIPTL